MRCVFAICRVTPVTELFWCFQYKPLSPPAFEACYLHFAIMALKGRRTHLLRAFVG
jgi:hypothetical protein